ncbi:hypothetical protein JTE90_004157 [Oedothorax gibbosus]|uniref:Uncharacterized protein n=1 Tax=Oedothorax gibbosus TaxID=931172 RepID=A0AAV6TU85_9ARAC|nr:hypothetical protein JTE90_004157 [Oedothorax gibbosus]
MVSSRLADANKKRLAEVLTAVKGIVTFARRSHVFMEKLREEQESAGVAESEDSELLSEVIPNDQLLYADELMLYFVANASVLYGREIMVYNVHSLVHLADDAIKQKLLSSLNNSKQKVLQNSLLCKATLCDPRYMKKYGEATHLSKAVTEVNEEVAFGKNPCYTGRDCTSQTSL